MRIKQIPMIIAMIAVLLIVVLLKTDLLRKNTAEKGLVPEHLSINKLEGVRWLNPHLDECTRYYEFRHEKHYFEHFNCALNELDTGRFEIINDTLKVYEYHLISQVPATFGGVSGTEIRYEYHYILNQGSLYQTYYRDHRFDYVERKLDTLHKYKRF